MKTKLPPLIPPDKKQCQAEKYEPFMMGGNLMRRCNKKPSVITKEVKPGADGRRGSMSLCPACLKACLKQLGKSAVTVTPIRQKP